MTIVLTDGQLKDAFVELVATAAHKNLSDVTYWSVLDYMKRNCETLIDDTVSTALRMYTSSQDYEKDVEYLKEKQMDWTEE